MVLFEIAKDRYKVYALGRDGDDCDLLDFLSSLGPNRQKDGDRLLALLERVSQNGPPRNTDISHQIRNEIFEFIQGQLRVLWFYEEGKVILCTHGFLKRSRKTPDREISRADLLRKGYLETKAKGPLMIIEREKKVIP